MTTFACDQILVALTVLPNPSGAELVETTGLSPSVLFLALQVLECTGLIIGEWENTPPPHRRLYRLAVAGQTSA